LSHRNVWRLKDNESTLLHYWYVKCGRCFEGKLCCHNSVIPKEMKQCQINLFEGHKEVQGLRR